MEIEFDADKNEATTVELRFEIVVTNEDDVAARAFDEDANDKITLELNDPIEFEADRNDAVADTSTDAILDVSVLNELVVETMMFTSDCDNNLSVLVNEAEVKVNAFDDDRNEATTVELRFEIVVTNEDEVAVIEFEADKNEDVEDAMTSLSDELNSEVIAKVTFPPAPVSVNDKPVPATKALSFTSEPVVPIRTYAAPGSAAPPDVGEEIMI